MPSGIRKFLPYLFVLFSFFVYLNNLSRSVYGGDVGDLISAAYVGGVAHPPGYPLFTLFGFLLTRISFGQTPAFLVGLISVFSSTFGVLIFYLIVHKLTKNFVVSIVSTSILAFSFLFWFYTEIAEVFALNNFFAILLIYLAILLRKRKDLRILLLFFLVLGISLTNHHTIIFIFPSLLIIIFQTLFKMVKKSPKVLLFCFLTFILGFSFYLYVPIASSKNPVINWDNVRDLSSFLHLFFRKDYGTFNAGIFEAPNFLQRLIIIKTYIFLIGSQLTLPVISLSILGFFSLLSKDKILSLALLIGFIISGPFFVLYAGFPLYGSFFFGVNERFFVLSTIFLLFLFPFGLIYLSNLLGKLLKKKYIFLFQAVFIIIPLLLFYYNFPKTNLSKLSIGENLSYDFISPLPKDSILLLSGDTLLFNSWYVQYTKNFRTDVKIINFNGIAGDGYFKKISEKISKENPKIKNENLALETIKKISSKRKVFSYSDLQISKENRLKWVPYGLGYELINDNQPLPSKEEFLKTINEVWKKFHIPNPELSRDLSSKSLTVTDIPLFYANAYLIAGNFVYTNYKDYDLAGEFYNKALSVDPTYAKTYEILGVHDLLLKKECTKAEGNFIKALGFNINERLPYFFLYAIYKDCLKNNEKANIMVKNFEANFGLNFYTELNKTIGKNNNKDSK